MKNDNTKLKIGKFSSERLNCVSPTLYTLHPTPSSRGFVLPFAVLLSGILLSIGLAIFSITLKELVLSAAGRESQFAFFAADAGAECALYWDLKHPGFDTSIFDEYQAGTTTSDTVFSIGYDSVSRNDRENTTNLTYSHTTGSNDNRMLIVGVEIEDTSTADCVVTAVTYGGTPLTKVTSVNAGSSTYMCVSLWYLTSPLSGSATVSVTTAGTVANIVSGTISLYNVAQQGPEAFNTNTVTNQSSISTSLTTVTDNAWVVDAVGSGEDSGFSSGSGQTEKYDRDSSSMQGAGSTRLVPTASVTATQWTQGGNSNRKAHIVAAFAPFVITGSEEGAVPHGAVSQNSGAQCGGADITDPTTGWDPLTGWDSTPAGELPVTTTFDMQFQIQSGTCARVTVEKDTGGTRVDSRGYNTCDLNSTRRVERGLRVRY